MIWRPLVPAASLLSLALAGCAGCNLIGGGDGEADAGGDAPDAAAMCPAEDGPEPLAAVERRPCRDDSFFIEVPLARALPQGFVGRIEDVRLLIERDAQERFCYWFVESREGGGGGQDGPVEGGGRPVGPNIPGRACPAAAEADLDRDGRPDVTAVATPVLAPTYQGQPHEGAERFFRFRFVDGRGKPLVVQGDFLCDAVDRLRTHLGAAGDGVYVGRECDAAAAGFEAHAQMSVLTEHLVTLGIDPDAVRLGAPDPAVPAVHVAIIDTDIDPVVASALGARVVAPREDFPSTMQHGTGMALLVRQVAPDARLHVLPVLDDRGSTPTARLADAILRVLDDPEIPLHEPLVINLSLGWAPESSHRVALAGRSVGRDGAVACSTREDPVGESVRYALLLAREADAGRTQRSGPVSVFAAAGNRSSAPHPSLDPVRRGQPGNLVMALDAGEDPCGRTPWIGPDVARRRDLFFPADWGRRPTCRAGAEGQGDMVATAVGAVTGDDRPAVLSTADAYAPLVAPGELVFVWADPAWPEQPAESPAEPLCDEAGEPGSGGFRAPAAYTGTSAATALVSGAAAKAHVLREQISKDRASRNEPALPRLGWRTLTGLLHATGAPIVGDAARPEEGVFRRLSVCGLEHALRCAAAPALLDCLAAGDRPIEYEAFLECARAAGCGEPDCDVEAPEDDGFGDLPVCSSTDVATVVPNACDPAVAALADPTWVECNTPRCEFDELALDRYELGSLGPQPGAPVCPCCVLLRSVASGDLAIAVNRELPTTTQITSPYLVIGSGSTRYSIKLPETGDLNGDGINDVRWVPGESFTLRGIKLPNLSDGAWSTADVTLVTQVRSSYFSTWAKDVSVLYLHPR